MALVGATADAGAGEAPFEVALGLVELMVPVVCGPVVAGLGLVAEVGADAALLVGAGEAAAAAAAGAGGGAGAVARVDEQALARAALTTSAAAAAAGLCSTAPAWGSREEPGAQVGLAGRSTRWSSTSRSRATRAASVTRPPATDDRETGTARAALSTTVAPA